MGITILMMGAVLYKRLNRPALPAVADTGKSSSDEGSGATAAAQEAATAAPPTPAVDDGVDEAHSTESKPAADEGLTQHRPTPSF